MLVLHLCVRSMYSTYLVKDIRNQFMNTYNDQKNSTFVL